MEKWNLFFISKISNAIDCNVALVASSTHTLNMIQTWIYNYCVPKVAIGNAIIYFRVTLFRYFFFFFHQWDEWNIRVRAIHDTTTFGVFRISDRSFQIQFIGIPSLLIDIFESLSTVRTMRYLQITSKLVHNVIHKATCMPMIWQQHLCIVHNYLFMKWHHIWRRKSFNQCLIVFVSDLKIDICPFDATANIMTTVFFMQMMWYCEEYADTVIAFFNRTEFVLRIVLRTRYALIFCLFHFHFMARIVYDDCERKKILTDFIYECSDAFGPRIKSENIPGTPMEQIDAMMLSDTETNSTSNSSFINETGDQLSMAQVTKLARRASLDQAYERNHMNSKSLNNHANKDRQWNPSSISPSEDGSNQRRPSKQDKDVCSANFQLNAFSFL